MITKERLKELIEQKAIIWYIVKLPIIAGYMWSNKIEKLTLDNAWLKIENGKLFITYPQCYIPIADLKDLFEIKEDAEWELEFGDIKRVETLKLPTWEEIHYKLDLDFIDKNKNKLVFRVRENFIDIINNKKKRIYGYDNVTKENYIEACGLCKKLFLGEKE